ncbi:hypothetical protein MUN82_00535 [Hymenobacter aerilatus]|uniref:Uncharacterized protein n=1 Tax=Hymenobacter aerilatus TaxID=2932251 RepID=A0A8T9STV7_9BACT|nr:hypothetical protein [Hymenobacter aerilatus]UOR05602.1 hypothetical protein MUN82_00535 [Hymenobacter aerilatus]
MRYFVALSCLLLTSACYQQSSQYAGTSPLAADTTAVNDMPLEAPDTSRAGSVSAQSDTLKVVQKRHEFSTPGMPDVFRLVLRGQNVLDGQIDFTIIAHTGQVIFHEMLSAADLEAAMVYDMAGTSRPTPTAREAYVRRRMDEFFEDKNFHQPALPSAAPLPAGSPLDRNTWADMQRRADTIGFQYLVGKEDRRRIAYSPLTKQVVQLGGFGS